MISTKLIVKQKDKKKNKQKDNPINNKRYKFKSMIFVLLLAIVGFVNMIVPDAAVSYSERRLLKQWTQIERDDFESYFLDQFLMRDTLRQLKGWVDYTIFKKNDIHDIYVSGGHAFLMQKPLDTVSVERFEKYILDLKALLPIESQITLGLIPDKSYYNVDATYNFFDYQAMINLLAPLAEQVTFLDLSELLTLDDYYETDLHWKQEALNPVKEAILSSFGHSFEVNHTSYQEQVFEEFYGGYFSRAPLALSQETLTYLTSTLTQEAQVTIVQGLNDKLEFTGVYNTEALGKMDSYDVFLYGAQSIVSIKKPESMLPNDSDATNKLIIFRDSFASSLAPLLLEQYDEITLVDLRYITPALALEILGPIDASVDILMLYQSQIVNQSLLLKR